MTLTPELPSTRSAADDVIGPLTGCGDEVNCTSTHRVTLVGSNVLWLVTAGAMDLFAVDPEQHGRWHFLGQMDPGCLVPGPVQGPRHTLVGRPLAGCRLRSLPLAGIVRRQREEWQHRRGAEDASPEERALCHGIDLGLHVLLSLERDSLPPREFVPLEPGQRVKLGDGQHARPVSGVVWVQVVSGELSVGTSYSAFSKRSAGDMLTIDPGDWFTAHGEATVTAQSTSGLLRAGILWPNLLNHQARFLYTLDRMITRIDHTLEERMRDSRQARDEAQAKADQGLLTIMDQAGRPTGDGAQLDPASPMVAAAQVVAKACGITVTVPDPREMVGGRLGAVGLIALRSGFRMRKVELKDQWWRADVGPLLGLTAAGTRPIALLWRRGAYQATDPDTGERWRVTKGNAGQVETAAWMFYRPLPHQPVGAFGLLRFGLRGNGADLRRMVVGGLASVAIGALVPILTGQVMGVFVPRAERSLIVLACLALVLSALVSAAFMLVQNLAILRVQGRLDACLQAAVWDRLLRLPAPFFAERSTGQLANAALGISTIRQTVSSVAAVAIRSALLGAVNTVMLLYYSVPLGLVAGGLVALSAAAFLVLGWRWSRWLREVTTLQGTLSNTAFHALRGLAKLRVAAAESFAYAHWAADFARSRELNRRIGRAQNMVSVLNVVYPTACMLVLFMLIAGPLRGSLSVAGFLSFTVAFSMALSAMTQLTGTVTSASSVVPQFGLLKPILRELPEVQPDAAVCGELSGEIEVSHLSFRYVEDAPLVLDDVSFRVEPGQFVAIVGGSGSGKSTLLRLLIGFEDPTQGGVLYDGQDLAGLDRTALRRQCGVVLQNTQPFQGSVLDCVSGGERFTLDEAWEGIEMAGLSQDIAAMPMGIHTVVSDGGGNLSGGQRQRLMIAAALVRKPRILFFDEATSALDNETQRIVTESTRKLKATRVVVAHRLSTVMDADRIIVMHHGRIVQQGSPTALLTDTDGMFYQLVRRQVR